MDKPKPRLLIVARDTYPPFRPDITDLFSYYLTRDFDLSWVMRSSEAEVSTAVIEASLSERFMIYGGSNRLFRQWEGLCLHTRTIKKIIRCEFNIVQCRDTLATAFFYAAASKLKHIPFCYWMSYPMSDGYIHRGWATLRRRRIVKAAAQLIYGYATRWIIHKMVLPMADTVFVQSEQMKKDVFSAGVINNSLVVVPMGVNDERYRIPIAGIQDPFGGLRPAVLYVGTLDEARRLEVAAKGVAEFLVEHKSATFTVIGKSSNAEKENILGPAREAGVADRFRFLSHMPAAELFEYVRSADICLAPYPVTPRMLASASPTKLVEYLYQRANVVANTHPDQGTVIEQAGSGVLVDFSASGFHTGLQAALRNPVCLEDREKAAGWVVKNRSYKVLAAHVGKKYHEILSGQK